MKKKTIKPCDFCQGHSSNDQVTFFFVLFLDSLQQMDARYLFFSPSQFISSRRSRQQFGWWIMNEVSIPLERQVKQVGWEKICLNIIKTTAPPSRRVNTEFFMAEGHKRALKRVMPALHLFVSASWCFKTSDAFTQKYFGLKCNPPPPKTPKTSWRSSHNDLKIELHSNHRVLSTSLDSYSH